MVSTASRVAALGAVLFVVALIPRLLGLSLFPTSDEDSWMRRTGGFAYALTSGEIGRTYQNGHPGVTTMWTGFLSLGPQEALRFADRAREERYVAKVPAYLESLTRARVGFAVLSALGVTISSLLVLRLFGPLPATLAGLALGVEPFLVANAQLVHVDGPLTTFVAIALLAALVRWHAGGNRAFLVLSAIATGLALLSKTPALFLLAFTPLLALAAGPLSLWERAGTSALRGVRASRRTRAFPLTGASDLLLWTAILFLTVIILWPAIWAHGPIEILRRVVTFTRETGGQPDEVGSFFLGQIGADPGPLYYPVATLFRLTPLVIGGLVALVLLVRQLPERQRWLVGWLVVFVLGFSAMMTLAPKKFDRYLLPIFPVLAVLAAVGWALVISWIQSARPKSLLSRVGAVAALLAIAIWPLASVYPYPLSYYNPLLGGGAVAQRAVMIGNGEGLDQAARWIAAQPDSADLRTASHSFDILAAMIPGDGEPLRDGVPNDADLIVTYGRRIQMHRWGPALDRYLQAHPPVYTVWINGIEYVRVHPGPRRSPQA
jgi:hypothetical protein